MAEENPFKAVFLYGAALFGFITLVAPLLASRELKSNPYPVRFCAALIAGGPLWLGLMASLYLVGNGIEQAVENLPWVPAMRGIIGNDLTTKLNLGGVSLMPLAAILVIHRGVVELVPGLKDLNALGERVLELGLRPDQW